MSLAHDDAADEIRSVSSPKSINPVITSDSGGVISGGSSSSERQRIDSHGSVTTKRPRHYLTGTSLCVCL